MLSRLGIVKIIHRRAEHDYVGGEKPLRARLGCWAVDHQREIEATRVRFDERNGVASSD